MEQINQPETMTDKPSYRDEELHGWIRCKRPPRQSWVNVNFQTHSIIPALRSMALKALLIELVLSSPTGWVANSIGATTSLLRTVNE